MPTRRKLANNSFLSIQKKPLHNPAAKEAHLELVLKRPTISLSTMSEEQIRHICECVGKFFNVRAASLYFYNYTLLSNYHHSNTVFNYKYRLVHIYKHLKKVFEHGNTYFALIKHNGNLLKRKIFIKELPSINVDLYLNHISLMKKMDTRFPNYFTEQFIHYLYNYSNPSYIDIFSHYLCSRLVEEGISPHFPLFYGLINTVFNKYTNKFTDRADYDDFLEGNDGVKKNEHYRTLEFDDLEKYKAEIKDFPVYLMATEVMDYDLADFIAEETEIFENSIGYDNATYEGNILSTIFQTIAALSVTHNLWSLYHNDLHMGNIMYKNTKQKFINYYYKNHYFRVPTFGRMVKIIDWNRATLSFNGRDLNNLEYDYLGDCREMYLFPTCINNKRPAIPPNPSFDLTLLAYEILANNKVIEKRSKVYKLLIEWTTMDNGENLYNKFGKDKEDDDLGFELYKLIAERCHNSDPSKQICRTVFNEYRVNKSNIPANEKIYVLG